MELPNVLSCPRCNVKFTEVCMFPCMHNFCEKCTNLMKNGAQTTCLICTSLCHQDDIKKNVFLEKICLFESQNKKSKGEEMISCEICDLDGTDYQADKYCVDCFQYICLKCSIRHSKSNVSIDHKIVDKNNVQNIVIKSPEPICEKHKIKFTIYCKTCDSLICPTCFIFYHSDHEKSDNVEEVLAKSNSDLKTKIIEIDDIIANQNKLIKKNKVLEANLYENCDKVQEEIESYANELHGQIDNLTKANVNKLNTLKNEFKTNLKEVTDYISLVTNLKSYFQEVINKGSNVDVFNSKKEMIKNTWIETKKPKLFQENKCSFLKPSLNKLISNELSGYLSFFKTKDLKLMLKNETNSFCVFKQNIYTVNVKDRCIDIYDNVTGEYQKSIDLKQYLNAAYTYLFLIFNTLNDLFINISFVYGATNYEGIFKLKNDNKTFFELKKLEYFTIVTTTSQQTLLCRTPDNIVIELSANGEELKRFTIPIESIFPTYSAANTAHQLIDGRYIVMSYDPNSVKFGLLDPQGTLIKTFSHPITPNTGCCTDGKKYIFVYEQVNENITVFSTDLLQLNQFNCPGVLYISYDQVNDILLLIKNGEIIHITYRLDMPDLV